MSDQLDTAGGWTVCPAGTISGMVCRSKTRQHLQNVVRVSATVTGLLVVVAAGLFLAGIPGLFRHSHPGGITCSEARAQLAASQTEQLGNEVAPSVEAHLSGCKSCREWLKVTFPDDSRNSTPADESQPSPVRQPVESGGWVPGIILVLR